MNNQLLDKAVEILKSGGVIAYPTEAVFGLGCDPFNEKAFAHLLHVKQRPIEKGVILIAGRVEQILPLVELEGTAWEKKVLQTWPGPFTWVLPVKSALPDWVTGGRETVAIRVTDHPLVQSICQAFGQPLVSTSANLTGQAPAKSYEEVKEFFNDEVYCLDGPLGDLDQPTQIWDAVHQTQIR